MTILALSSLKQLEDRHVNKCAQRFRTLLLKTGVGKFLVRCTINVELSPLRLVLISPGVDP